MKKLVLVLAVSGWLCDNVSPAFGPAAALKASLGKVGKALNGGK